MPCLKTRTNTISGIVTKEMLWFLTYNYVFLELVYMNKLSLSKKIEIIISIHT